MHGLLLVLALGLTTADFDRQQDVIYGRKFGSALTLDVLRPKTKANGLGVIFVVSGGWYSSHDIDGMTPVFAPLLDRGYTVFPVVHGSQPKYTIPEAIQDLNRAVRFIRFHAKDYAIDPDRLGIYGMSAGCHLSLMQGTAGSAGDPNAKDPVDRVSSRVQAVAGFYPPTDFLNYGKPGQDAIGRGILHDFAAPFDFREWDADKKKFVTVTDEVKVRELGRQVSPITHVSADDPPTLIFHGDKDGLVPIQQSEIFVEKMKQAGAVAKLVVKPGAEHGWPGQDKEIVQIAEWFDEHLKPKEVPPAAGPAPGGMEVYFIDVDGGAATLVVTPARESILIDSGWPGRDDRDPKRIVHVLKDIVKLDHLDHLVTTHWHMDHFGGVEGLAKLVEIRQFWDRGLPEDQIPGLDFPDGPKADDPMGIAYRKASQGKRKALKPGDRLPLKGVEALVLTSGGRVIDFTQRYPGRAVRDLPGNAACESAPADLPTDTSDNARSVTILFTAGKFQFLDCGDLTWNVEKKLVCPSDLIGPVDLFQVTHHGMAISNHPTLLRTIAPTVAVMDNGPRKGGDAKAVKLLKSMPSIQALYQLHKNAATGPDDNTSPDLTANPDPKGGQFLKVAVSPEGDTFAVTIGADGKPARFASK